MDDEFFGDLTGDDHAGIDVGREENPQQAGVAKVVDGLAGHEQRAGEETYRNMGFLEAFDAAKELRLQDGFEAGYRETVGASTRIGHILGSLAVQAIAADFSVPRDDHDKSSSKETAQSKSAAILVRSFLDESQRENNCDCDEEEMSARLRKVERELGDASTKNGTV